MYRDKSEKSQMVSESINLDAIVSYFLSQINRIVFTKFQAET